MLYTNDFSKSCVLREETVGIESISHKVQLSGNMQINDKTSVNWGAPLGDGSAQGDVATQRR